MTTLAELERRVDAIERDAQLAAYSALNGMVVAADGSITYDFEGRIKADGLDFDVDASLSGRRIRWSHLGTTGQTAAEIFGFDTGGTRGLQLTARDDAGADDVTNGLFAIRGANISAVLLRQDAFNEDVRVQAGPLQKTVINSLEESSFLQLGSVQQELKAEIQAATFLAVAAGNQGRTVASPFTFTNWGAAVLSVSASINSAGLSVVPVNAAAGSISFAFQNNPALQAITVTWLSFGN